MAVWVDYVQLQEVSITKFINAKAPLTIDQRHQMGLLMLATVNVCSKTNQRVDCDVVCCSLEVELQIFPLKAKELSLVNNYTNFLR